jgi:hypothetical protein
MSDKINSGLLIYQYYVILMLKFAAFWGWRTTYLNNEPFICNSENPNKLISELICDEINTD